MAEHGRVIAVGDEFLGDEFAEDTAAGATVLQLVDTADFDEEGGKVRIGGEVVTYLAIDDEAATMTLAAGLAANADAGDRVDSWDIASNATAVDRIATVVFDGMNDGDGIDCVVAQHLRRQLPTGIRAGRGESVLIERDGDEWRVIDVLGADSTTEEKAWQDTFILTGTGDQSVGLTLDPIPNSEHVYWEGLYQREQIDWNRVDQQVNLIGAALAAGDEVEVEYLYLTGQPFVIDFNSHGWRYKEVALADATDYTSPIYDHSTWATGQAPFGGATGGGSLPATPNTAWAVDTSLWLRRIFPPGSRFQISGIIEDTCVVYWNGVEIGTANNGDSGSYDTTFNIDVPAELISSSFNVLAIRCNDEAGLPPGGSGADGVFIDLRVIGETR